MINMKKCKYLKYVLLLLLLVFLSGCASSYYSRGQQALKDENYNQAIRELKQAVGENPKNLDAIRDLGIALYHKGNSKIALRLLKIAALKNPDDPVVSYYLGQVYEDAGQLKEAISLYKNYVNLSPLNPFRQQLEQRLVALVKLRLKQELQKTLTQESLLEIASIPDNAIAVLYFLNMNKSGALTPLQKGLTEMLITDLSQIEGLTVVERARLQTLMEEMGMSQAGVVDEATAARFGKLLGASKVVQGTLTQLDNNQLRVDAGITNIKGGGLTTTTNAAGSLRDLFKLEKDMVFNIIDEMGIKISPQERRAIERVPTKNLVAYMYYCKALDQEDRGLYDQAELTYKAALAKDPGFTAATQGIERSRAYSNYKKTAGTQKPNYAKVTAGGGRGGKGSQSKKSVTGKRNTSSVNTGADASVTDALGSRLDRTALSVSSGFLPGVESREATTEENASTFGSSAPITIKIPIPVVQP